MASGREQSGAPPIKQERAKKTREALVRAGAKVFAEKGFEGAQTPDIAAEAGVSTGALYRYFKDKRELFIEVVAAYLLAGSAAVAEKLSVHTFAGADRRGALDIVIDILFAELRRDVALSRVYMAMSLTDPAVGELRARFEANERAALAKILAATIPREIIADPEAAALVIQVAAVEVAADRSGLRPTRGKKISDKAVKVALREMLYRFLFPGEPPPPLDVVSKPSVGTASDRAASTKAKIQAKKKPKRSKRTPGASAV